MVSDTERGIQRIRYNVLDLPSRVEFRNDTIPDIYYLYAANGRKLEQGTIHSTNGTHFGDIQYIYTPHITYQGNLAYVDGVLDRILIDGGYISAADNVYHFFVTDHLGSVRVVARADGTVEKCYDYDPYGSDLSNNQNTTVPAINPYKFNGKEFVQRLNHYDFGARLFGPSIRRWTTMDPLCEKYYSWSPYAYCAGNPMNIVDPEGEDIAILIASSGLHMAILIQNNEGKWAYYSINGDNVYSGEHHIGGRPFNDLGEALFDSPDAFLNSYFNTDQGKEGKENKSVANYDYMCAFIIKTDDGHKQDNLIKDEFVKIAENEPYSLTKPNHCATVVQRSIMAVGIDATAPYMITSPTGKIVSQGRYLPYIPMMAYR